MGFADKQAVTGVGYRIFSHPIAGQGHLVARTGVEIVIVAHPEITGRDPGKIQPGSFTHLQDGGASGGNFCGQSGMIHAFILQ